MTQHDTQASTSTPVGERQHGCGAASALTPAARDDRAQGDPHDASIAALVAAQAAAHPQAVALVAGAEVLHYGALDARANRLALYLQSLGVGPDVLVGLYVDRSAALGPGALAISKSGGA